MCMKSRTRPGFTWPTWPTWPTTLYRNARQTATIAASPFRQDRKMTSNGAATRTATEERLYRIGDVSRLADLKPFVLRYWETEFPMLQPMKSPGGLRLYRQEDVDMVFRIKRLLYDEGFTIAGARRHLREKPGSADLENAACGTSGSHPEEQAQLLSRKMLLDMRDAPRAFLALLERRGSLCGACCFSASGPLVFCPFPFVY